MSLSLLKWVKKEREDGIENQGHNFHSSEKRKEEWDRNGKVGCEEKPMKRSDSEYWTLVVKKKEGKKVSNLKISKGKKESKIAYDVEYKISRECKEEWKKIFRWVD